MISSMINDLISMITLKITPMTRKWETVEQLYRPKVEELKTLVDGEVPPICPVQK